MNVVEARRARHLLVHLGVGDTLPESLVRALDRQEARSGFIRGAGSLEHVQIAVWDNEARRFHPVRTLEGACELLSLVGTVAPHHGQTRLVARAILARETPVGLETFGGRLIAARASNVDLHVVAFDDVTPMFDDSEGAAAAESTPGPGDPLSDSRSVAAGPGHPSTAAAGPGHPSTAAAGSSEPSEPPILAGLGAAALAGTTVPLRPRRISTDDETVYPELDDLVNHFHFGECIVVGSDGERIRLRQQRDGRMREVSLAMLRVEPPSADAATGKRHFNLLRKN